ncbi:MAG: CDP-alcohol phosphatidyltransferase family protein [Candidatus Marinimicrobia bacterium]|nr:CDP-alcohol phosphatidyltransferase family protein [Candidatus Neomarinimicrobiota bacterium]
MAIEPLSELKKICWKETETVWYAKYFIRHLSIRVTRMILPLGISANQATLIGIIIGILACILIGTGSIVYSILGVGLLQLSYIFDCVDGEIARYKKQSSVNGIFIDFIGHEVLIPFSFLALTFFLYNNVHQTSILLLGVLAAWSSTSPTGKAKGNVLLNLLGRRSFSYFDYSKLSGGVKSKNHDFNEKSILSSFFLAVFYYPGSMNIISVMTLLYFFYPSMVLISAQIYFSAHILLQIYLPIKWYRQNSVEKDFLSLRDKVLKTYKDQKSQKS